MCTILTRHASINQIKSHWKTSEGEKQAYICCMFVEGKSKTVFFPSDTLIYGICRDGTKNNNIRACEHLILGQFRMGARSAIYAPLTMTLIILFIPHSFTWMTLCPTLTRGLLIKSTLTDKMSSTGDTVSYTCNGGYLLQGSAVLKCKKGGRWNS